MCQSRGQLLPTKAGQRLAADPRAVLRHIASALPLGKPHERDAGVLALLVAATGRSLYDERASAGDLMADARWSVSGGDLGLATYSWASRTTVVLNSLAGRPGRSADPEFRARVARALLRRA